MNRVHCFAAVFLCVTAVCLQARPVSELQSPVTTPRVQIPDSVKDSEQTEDSWLLTLDDLALKEGEAQTLTLDPGGRIYPVSGTGIYTSFSSVGTAAVHAGLITPGDGGDVTVMAIRGLEYYPQSERNGVFSHIGGRGEASFVFLDDDQEIVTVPIEASWSRSAAGVPPGTVVSVLLPPGGVDYFVFGSGPYDVDSSVGAAAVHAGLISFEEGGMVNVEITDIPPNGTASTANGVSTRSVSGESGLSFRFMVPR